MLFLYNESWDLGIHCTNFIHSDCNQKLISTLCKRNVLRFLMQD